MKTLIEQTDNSSTYEFSDSGRTKIAIYTRTDRMPADFDFEAASDADHDFWLQWLGETSL